MNRRLPFVLDVLKDWRASSLSIVTIVAIITISANTFAASRNLVFEDPQGDSFFTGTNLGDLIQLDFTFDSITGDYLAIFIGNSEILFSGEIEVNLHLLNTNLMPDGITLHSQIPEDAYLVNNFNIVSLPAPTSTVSLSGNFIGLTNWEVGDAILPGTCAYMLENGCWQSTIQGFPPGGDLYDGLDMAFGDERLITSPTDIHTVPIPALWHLPALLFLGIYGSHKNKTEGYPPNKSPQSARVARPTPYRSPFWACFAFYAQKRSLKGAAGAKR